MRHLARWLLGLVFLGAIGLIAFVLHAIGLKNEAGLATLTALLAVIAAVISAWPAIRVLELQEDATRPRPEPYFDLNSRYSLMLLRVKNLGAGIAYDVRINWKDHPLNESGEEVSALDEIPALMPQDSASVLVGRPMQLFQLYPAMQFAGTVEFRDAKGRRMKHNFSCSADEHRRRLVHDEEMPKALYDIQKIPSGLDEIAKAIREFQK